MNLSNARLYLVLDTAVRGYDELFDIMKVAVQSGVDVVQLRDKQGSARDIFNFSRRALGYLKKKVPFIINDRVDLVLASQADGVHLGQDDLPVATARKILGKKAIIGASCQTLAHAVAARKAEADYIGFGSVFKTLTKPDRQAMDLRLFSAVVKKSRLPVFAIGGIDLENVRTIFAAGGRRVAVTRALCLAGDCRAAARNLRKTIDAVMRE